MLYSLITSVTYGVFRSMCRVWLDAYHGAFEMDRSILDWARYIMAMLGLLAQPLEFYAVGPYGLDDCFVD
jgi:hypothetical protein